MIAPWGRRSLTFTRRYASSLDILWSLWTTKQGFESWWAPDDFQVVVHLIEPHKNGRLRYDMFTTVAARIDEMTKLGRQAKTETTGRFSEVVHFRHLVIDQRIDFIPGVHTYDHRIAVTFERSGAQVDMTVEVDVLHDFETTERARFAMEQQLAKLQRRLEWSGRD